VISCLSFFSFLVSHMQSFQKKSIHSYFLPRGIEPRSCCERIRSGENVCVELPCCVTVRVGFLVSLGNGSIVFGSLLSFHVFPSVCRGPPGVAHDGQARTPEFFCCASDFVMTGCFILCTVPIFFLLHTHATIFLY